MTTNLTLIEDHFNTEDVMSKFQNLLGKKSKGFIASVLQVVSNNSYLSKASKESIFNASATAAALDLPIQNNLGLAYIVPYKGNAQFQIGWKGFVQLALRSNQYERINVVEVYANQFESYDSLFEELKADFTKKGEGEPIGYVAYFKLLNGFKKTCYWTKADVEKHAQKFSKTYNSANSVWKTNFDGMAKKTVIKNTLSKWGFISLDMQTAIEADQSVQMEENQHEYPDNTDFVEAEIVDVKSEVAKCSSTQQLMNVWSTLSETEQQEHKQLFQERKNQLNK